MIDVPRAGTGVASGARYDGGASAAAIQAHYDVGNDFYALWLDPTMSYSSGLFESDDDSLHQAQLAKLDWVGVQIAGSGRVLEIGCGWGGLMRRLLERHGVASCVGLTLSIAQRDYCLTVLEAAQTGRAEVRLESWAEHRPAEPYDAIVSIEAFEAFARPEMTAAERIACYRSFFEACHEAAKPGSRLVIQAITYGSVPDIPDGKQFFAKVFPESDCPRLEEMLAAADGLYELRLLRNDREDYVRTLNLWLRNLKRREVEAIHSVGEETLGFYKQYLALSAIGFRTHSRRLDRLVWSRLGR